MSRNQNSEFSIFERFLATIYILSLKMSQNQNFEFSVFKRFLATIYIVAQNVPQSKFQGSEENLRVCDHTLFREILCDVLCV